MCAGPVDGAEGVLERIEEGGRSSGAGLWDRWEEVGVEGAEAPGAEGGEDAGEGRRCDGRESSAGT